MWPNSKIQIATKLKNLNCDKTLKYALFLSSKLITNRKLTENITTSVWKNTGRDVFGILVTKTNFIRLEEQKQGSYQNIFCKLFQDQFLWIVKDIHINNFDYDDKILPWVFPLNWPTTEPIQSLICVVCLLSVCDTFI